MDSAKIKWMTFLMAIFMLILAISGCVKKETEQKKEVKLSFEPRMLVLQTDSGWKVKILMALPTPCHKVEYIGKQLRGHEYYFDFTYVEPEKPCAQVITNYNRTIDLGELEKGNYTIILRINGDYVKKINFKVQ